MAWAYAGTLEEAGTSVVGNVALGYSDSSNYAVVLNQTTSSGPLIDLSIARLISTRSYIIACYPNCANPVAAMTASGVGYEFDTAQLILTREARVAVGGSSVAALGLLSENLTLTGNLTVRFTWENYSGGGTPRGEWFNATTLANTTGQFTATTPLGLLPLTVTTGENWTGTGVFQAAASTQFVGRSGYAGRLVPSNGSEFNGTSVPISPMTVSINGSDTGTPANAEVAGDAAVAFVPASDHTSLLEGAVIVPTSAYIAASFASSCDEAQRACIGIGATPQLDVNATESDHLGWDAAVSTLSAFSLTLDPSAVLDTPDGLPFWPTAAAVTPPAITAQGPAVDPATTVTGLPIPVPIAVSIQHDFYPTPGPNGSSGVPPPTAPARPRYPTSIAGRGSGSPAAPGLPLLVGAAGSGGLPWVPLLAGLAVIVGIGLGASTLAARRRRPPRRRDVDPLDLPPTEPAPEGGEPSEDPMGYVW
ncbi:MAG: hypothetical protein L3K08_04150 [Thermoplasmata archaeon]|nr:hypothetical protein [Thermoplasmata archaeon]